MPPILEQEPAVNWSEDHKRRPEAHAGNPAATAEQIPFAWKKDAGVDGANATRCYLDSLRKSAATPEQRDRGIALLRETARRLRKRQTATAAPETTGTLDAAGKPATPAPQETAAPTVRKSRRRTPRPQDPSGPMTPDSADGAHNDSIQAYA